MEIKENRLIDQYFKIFPEIIMHNHTYQLKRFVKEVSEKCLKGKKIIDVGAGTCQYKKYFKNLKYYSQDIINNPQKTIDYIGEIDILPSNSFDYILCTQVLEHLKEPKEAFNTFSRILKKNGKLFLTTHMAFEEHLAPYDYFRYTKYGLKYLAEENNFKVERIIPQGGRFLVLAKEIQILIPRLIKNKILIYIYYLLFTIPIFILSLVLYLLDYLDKDKELTLNYECVFDKKN